MRASGVAALTAVVLSGSNRIEARTFAEILGRSLPVQQAISRNLAVAIGRALPVTSASAGVVFSFDPTTGAFERETAILGQLFLERAEPLGRGVWNLSLNYQRVQLDRFDGEDIEHLSDTIPIRDPRGGGLVVFPLFGLDLETQEVTASATYGLTDDVDVNLTVPVLYSEFRVRLMQASVVAGSLRDFMHFGTSSSKLGVGDIFIRGKYRFLTEDWIRAAFGLVLRLPAGLAENFQGTGAAELAPMLYASTRSLRPSQIVRLQPYVNAGINVDADDAGASEARWGLGLDVGIGQRTTLAAAVLARHGFRRIIPAGLFTFERADGSFRPLFGIRGDRPDIYDLSLGARINVWRDTVIAFANVILPLNDDGVRSDVIPTIGIEATL